MIIVSSCASIKQSTSNYSENCLLKDDINNSIIDGFYTNDTINISKTIYLIK